MWGVHPVNFGTTGAAAAGGAGAGGSLLASRFPSSREDEPANRGPGGGDGGC